MLLIFAIPYPEAFFGVEAGGGGLKLPDMSLKFCMVEVKTIIILEIGKVIFGVFKTGSF